ncbi:MAG: rod shape-determining protein MreD [Streptococcaceae bacterium]|jgi:rod shape-determining protein MreD|nr:rod shape-determining protein MreD [Streptococcaceae bacterium]
MSHWAFQFFSPIILFFLILVDSHFSIFLTGIFSAAIIPVSHLFLIFLMYTTLKHHLTYLIIMSVLLGIIYDSYFLGVIGIAAAIFPLISLFLYEIRDTVFQNRWTRIFATVIIVFTFEIFSYGIEFAFGLTSLAPLTFISKELAASLVLNIILATALQWPLEALYQVEKAENVRKFKKDKNEIFP